MVITKAGAKCKKCLKDKLRIWNCIPRSVEEITQVSDVIWFLLQQNIPVPSCWWVAAPGGRLQLA